MKCLSVLVMRVDYSKTVNNNNNNNKYDHTGLVGASSAFFIWKWLHRAIASPLARSPSSPLTREDGLSGPSCRLALRQAILSLRAASLSGGVCEHLPPRSALSLSPGLATRTAKPVLGLAHAPRGPSEPAPDPTPVLCPAGVPGRRRPPGLLRGPRPRGPAHHPRACVGEPLPREEVLLYHPLTAL